MDGFININKPKEFTSHDVVNVLKRSFRGQKIGHGGTLDPSATGVLPICLGKGTKLQSYVMGLTKEYRAEIAFGFDSPTLDLDGDFVVVNNQFHLDENKLKEVLDSFLGEISQIPPMVSAIKKDGVPLYKLAQRGVEIKREPRNVVIHSIDLISVSHGVFPKITIDVICGKGTYIRSLARDIGEAMGTSAVVSELKRISTGSFSLDNAYSMEDIAAMVQNGEYSFLLPMGSMLTEIPSVVVKDMQEVKKVLTGNEIHREVQEETVKIMDSNDTLLALGENIGDGKIKPYKILFEPRKRKKPMEIWEAWDDVKITTQDTAVALGNFDGVHCGHEYLMASLAKEAEAKNLKSVIATFAPHPREYFGSRNYKYLQTKGDKIKHIDKTGADAVLLMPFDEGLASKSYEIFFKEILVKKLRAKIIYVGYNFKFGAEAQGTGSWLKEHAKAHGIEVVVLDKLTYGGDTISSSEIKEALQQGNLEKANGMLGYLYRCHGQVVLGNQLGRTIGFPTANIAVSDRILLPANGIYTTWISYRGKRHPSVTNIGNRPTVGENLAVTVETHILDDAPNLYGEIAEVTFLNRIRAEEKFESFEVLQKKIQEDADIARAFFERRKENRK